MENKEIIFDINRKEKFMIVGKHFYDFDRYYIYVKKSSWFGLSKKWEPLHDDVNNGYLKSLDDAKKWLEKYTFKDKIFEVHYI